MIDPLSVASNGYLSKYKKPLSVASDGYLSVYALLAIDVGGRYYDLEEKNTEEVNEELLMMIKIFMEVWDL